MLTDGIFIDEYGMKERVIEEIVDKQGMYSFAGPHGIGKTFLAERIGEEIEKGKERYKGIVWAYVCMTQEYKNTKKNILSPLFLALDSGVREKVRSRIKEKHLDFSDSITLILNQLQKRIVLVLDEFQNIEEQPQLMESLYQWYKTKKLSILFIARPQISVLWKNIKEVNGLEKKIEKDWVDDITNIGKCYVVPGFTQNAREGYLRACISNSKKNVVISTEAAKVIYYYAGGHPHTLYDIMNATELKIRQKKDGEELRASDVSIPIQAIEGSRFKTILEQMESVIIGEKNAKDLFFETFENSGLDKAKRYENAMRLHEQGYLVEVSEEESCCKLLGLRETGENESVSMKSIRTAMNTYKNYITVEGYEPMSPYFLVYCGKQYKDEVSDVGDKLKRMELNLREFLFGKLILRYGDVESILKMLVFLFPTKDFPTQSADAERQAASNGMHKLKKPLTALSFGDYLMLMKLHWKTPFFSCFSNDDCKHMFTGWTKSDVEKVNRWEELSDREREKLRRVSFARARNTTAHENIGPDEVFAMKQLQKLKEDIEAIQGELDKGEGLEKPIVTGYEKYCLVGRSFLFVPSSLQPDASGNLEGVLSELTYKAYLKEEEYRENEAVTVVCWDAAKNAFRVSYQTSVNGNYRNISNIPYDNNYQNYPNFANTVEAFWFNKIDKNRQHKVNNEKVPAYAWDGFIVANVDDAAQRKYYPATINEEKVFVQGLILPMNEGSTANNRGPLSVEGVPYRVNVQKVTDNNGKVSYSVTDIVYGE